MVQCSNLILYFRRWRGFEDEKEEDKEQELCNAITAILLNIMWKGYDVHQTSVWKVSLRSELVYPSNNCSLIKRLFLFEST